jgi:signal transduction histidine kinase
LLKERHAAALRANGPVQFEYFSNRIDRWIEVTTYPSESGLSVFFRDITERKYLQEQLLREREHHQMRVAGAVVKATEKERAEVSKELHDNVNQVLTTVKLYTELCLSHTPGTDELLKKSMELLQNSINEIRSLSKRLSATSLGKIRLADSVRELVDSIRNTSPFKVNFEQNIPDLDISDDVHLTTYRILQEQFTNIINHAQATVVYVRMYKKENTLLVEVTDNGVGFDLNKVHEGIGIANMTTRAADVNAAINIHSVPGVGSTLILTIPLT